MKIKLYHGDGEAMEFEWIDTSENYYVRSATKGRNSPLAKTGICHLRFNKKGEPIFYDVQWSIIDIKPFNPTHFEVIEEKECPVCGGEGETLRMRNGRKSLGKCSNNCTDGKIEEVTGKYEWINEYDVEYNSELKEGE